MATIVLETAIEVAFGAVVIVAVMLGGDSLGLNGSMSAVFRLAAQPAALPVVSCGFLAALAVGLVHRRRAPALLGRMAAGFAIRARLGHSSLGCSRGS